ncbi:MAG: hypothetical protein ACXV0U_10575 [Kineosporiaceae bacterium]
MTARIIEESTFDPGQFDEELAAAPENLLTVVDGGVGRQRTENDGTMTTREYHVGDTNYSEHSSDAPMIQDFENAGDTEIRFVPVELLD